MTTEKLRKHWLDRLSGSLYGADLNALECVELVKVLSAPTEALPTWAFDLESAWAEWSGGHITDFQFTQATAQIVVKHILCSSGPQSHQEENK